MTGYVLMAAGGAISWKSRKRSAVATCTTEADNLALGMAAQESDWIERMLASATRRPPSPETSLFIDHQGTIKMAKYDASGKRTKHIDIKYYLMQDLVVEKTVPLNSARVLK